MKLWLIAASVLLLITGCTSKREIVLQNRLIKQRIAMQAKQAQINALNEKLLNVRVKSRTRTKVRQSDIPKAPKNNYKPKKVEDTNYSSGYMYPRQARKRTVKVVQPTPTSIVTAKKNTHTATTGKAECIAMIGQAKFDKYSKMFGSETASLKRCKMLKSMQ